MRGVSNSRCLLVALAGSLAVVAALSTPATGNGQTPVAALNDPEASGPVEPTSLGPGGQGDPEYVQRLKWADWGDAQATGEGAVQAYANEGPLDPELHQGPPSPVTVTLGGLVTCAGYSIYTAYELTVKPGFPTGPGWSKDSKWRFPCKIAAGNYRPDTKADGLGACQEFGSDWTPSFRGAGFCRLDWIGFGTRATAVGKGVVRNGLAQWAAEVTLSDIQWCPTGLEEDALSYTHVTMATYGGSENLLTGHGPHPVPKGDDPYNITVAEADHLRARIGRPGYKKHAYRGVGSFVRGCEPLTGSS